MRKLRVIKIFIINIIVFITLIIVLIPFLSIYLKNSVLHSGIFNNDSNGSYYSMANIKITDNNINFIKDYFNYVNHARSPTSIRDFTSNASNNDNVSIIAYSEYLPKKKQNQIKVLVQGDSWMELFDLHAKSIIPENVHLINGGTSSYSPSLMSGQLLYLYKKRDFKPDYVIAYIDQTDVGDELCRYKDYVKDFKYKSVKGKIVEPFPTTTILLTPGYTLRIGDYLKIRPWYTMFELIYYAKNRILLRSVMFSHNKKKYQKYGEPRICPFSEASKPLTTISESEEKIFFNTIISYIDTIKAINVNAKIILITHPHKSHLNGIYKYSVSSTINNITNTYGGLVRHIDMNIVEKKTKYEYHWQEYDRASHLNKRGINELMKYVFSVINL